MIKIIHNKKFILMTVLLVSILNSQCAPKTYSISDYEKMDIFEYIKLPEDKLSIKIASLIIAKEINPNMKFMLYILQIKSIASRANELIKDVKEPEYIIHFLNIVIYNEFGLHFDKEDYNGMNIQNRIITGVLDRRMGVCTGMPLLYMVIAEELNLPIYAVSAPSHVLCRYVYGKSNGKEQYYNIETTSGGGQVEDVELIAELKIPLRAFINGVYLKTLSKKEYIGLLVTEAAHSYVKQKDYDKAIKYIEEGLKLYNKHTSAHSNLVQLYNWKISQATFEFMKKKYQKEIKMSLKVINHNGLAPPAPIDYWKESPSKAKVVNPNRIRMVKGKYGLNFYEDLDEIERIKTLKERYRGYFEYN